ncbi:unnamed protein product [Pieris macdunnoughi]|uniref:DDE-1 domain-containing protein n=1 Tax=Pieris macdunnoughi TaxID=345717 RepID=A0A821W8J0_9NEOP|nr:unnamed protein product [Pieris macdunnoughi]
MSAGGTFVPPMMIFPRKRDNPLLMKDGHASHTRNIKVVDLARENHVHLLSLPPHSSHKMQPLDKTFMGPLKKYLTEETRKRMQPRAVTHFDIAGLFGLAYIRAQRAELAISGFRATGIYPVNRHVYEDHDFIDEDLPEVEGPSNDPARDMTTPVNIIPDNPIPEPRAVVLWNLNL